MRKLFIGTLLFLSTPGLGTIHRQVADSGNRQVQLIELYSSESCSSCPPADQWLSGLKSDSGLWKKFVPLALHVDYWNDLGWKDEYSSPAMTKRQREIAGMWDQPSVYTPAVIVDGSEWRAWRQGSFPSGKTSAGQLQLTVFQESTDDFQVVIRGLERGSYTVHVAKLGMGLASNVVSGENSGRRLTHDFLVLAWDEKTVSENSSLNFHLHSPAAAKLAIAAWIEKAGRPVPLQAAGGYL